MTQTELLWFGLFDLWKLVGIANVFLVNLCVI
jgi:hypothetical protein